MAAVRRGDGPEEELAVLSAGTALRRQRARPLVDRIESRIDWSRMSVLLRSTRLLPTLGPRTVALVEDRAEASFKAELEVALEAGRRQDALLELTSARVVSALSAEGISASSLKGPELAARLYGGAGRRLSSDVDLLVDPVRLGDAVEVVHGLGYEPPESYARRGPRPLLHIAMSHERGMLPPVELHWRIHWYEQRFAAERLLPPTPAARDGWRPEREDELVALLLFYARDGFMSLRQAADLAAWWDRFGAELRPGAFDRSMRAHRALEPALLAALRAAEGTVGLPAARVSDRAATVSRRGRLAARLANPLSRSSVAQVYADMGLVDALLTPSGGLRQFAARQLAPSGGVATEGTAAAARPGIAHSLRVLARYGLSLLRLARTELALDRRRVSGRIVDRA